MKWVWWNLYWIQDIKFGIVLSPSVRAYKEKPRRHVLHKEVLVGLYEDTNFALLQQWGQIGDFFQQGCQTDLLYLQ